MCHNQGPALLPQVSGRGGSGPKWCPRWPASRSACCPQSWCTSPPSNLSQPGGPQWTQVPHWTSECSSPEYVASQTPTASSSAVSPEGIETKTDGTYSGNASLLTSFTSSAAMEAVELDARRQTVGLAADFSPSWKVAHAPNTPSHHTCFPNVRTRLFWQFQVNLVDSHQIQEFYQTICFCQCTGQLLLSLLSVRSQFIGFPETPSVLVFCLCYLFTDFHQFSTCQWNSPLLSSACSMISVKSCSY